MENVVTDLDVGNILYFAQMAMGMVCAWVSTRVRAGSGLTCGAVRQIRVRIRAGIGDPGPDPTPPPLPDPPTETEAPADIQTGEGENSL